ncbi:DUF5313 family protein [Amycolatopsis sp. NPDC059657]|uniref:DUF5313 family protein n=1 Tax=Amycolatopsis sp. NPDC059657 TaxID=3346899 RepID=UPI003671019C
MDTVTRPGPLHWLWYAVGGRLPEKNHTWVLHDLTDRGWLWRHGARSSVMLAPLILGWLLLPAPLGLRLALCLMAALVGYFYSYAYAEEAGEHRLARHGFPIGTGRRIRDEAREAAEAEAHANYLIHYRT